MSKLSIGNAIESAGRCNRPWFQNSLPIAALILIFLYTIAAPVLASSQQEKCSEQKILGNDPRNNAKLVLCIPELRNDPAIVTIIDMLNRLNESNQKAAPRVQELVSTLASTTDILNAKQRATLADSIAKQLLPALQQSDTRALREIDRMRIGMEDIREKLALVLELKGTQTSAREAINGDTGDAIAHLEFDRANRTLDSMMSSLTAIDGKLKSPFEADPARFSLTKREAELAWGKLNLKHAKQLCPQDLQSIVSLRDAAIDEERRGDIRTAGSSYDELKVRIESLVFTIREFEKLSRLVTQLNARPGRTPHTLPRPEDVCN